MKWPKHSYANYEGYPVKDFTILGVINARVSNSWIIDLEVALFIVHKQTLIVFFSQSKC